MNLENILKKMIDAQSHAIKEGEKITIGKISPELLNEFHKARELENDVDYEIELRKKQLEAEAEEKLFHEFKDKLKEVKQKFENAWNQVYEEFGIEDKENYTINRKTGVVSKEVDQEEFSFETNKPLQ